MKLTIENLARYALSPLQILFPAGLAVGLFGLGAGLLGVGAVGLGGYALDRAAADVSGRRRQALGLGVSYGSLSAYDLNFSRFGLGAQTLGNVAAGVYDVTSPQFLPLLTSGANTGDTASAAVDLIKNLPAMLQGVPDQMVGPVARSRGWTNILDLGDIIRLKNAGPEEIQRQIANYEADKKTLDISAEAQKKWADFDAAITRAGRKIETVLADRLGPLAEPLGHLSESAVHLIDALIGSGAVAKGLGVIESGLEEFGDAVSGDKFKGNAKRFLSGLEGLTKIFALPSVVAALGAGTTAAAGAALPLLGALARSGRLAAINAATLGIGAGLIGKAISGHWNDPLTGLNKRLAENLGLAPRTASPSLRYRGLKPGAPPSDSDATSVAGISAKAITPGPREKPSELYDRLQATYPQLTSEQCVELVRKVAQIKGGVWDWRRGVNVHSADLPTGTPLATFMDRQGNPSQFYDAHQGVGAPGNNTTHAAVLVGYAKDGSGIYVAEQYVGSHGIHIVEKKWRDPRGGEFAAENYFSINDTGGLPAGDANPWRQEVLNQIEANRAPLNLPGATSATPVGGSLGADNRIGLRNPALRNRGRALHSLDPRPAAGGLDHGIPVGHLTVYDYSGGAVTVTSSNVHTAQ